MHIIMCLTKKLIGNQVKANKISKINKTIKKKKRRNYNNLLLLSPEQCRHTYLSIEL